jgi:hypothetical protein
MADILWLDRPPKQLKVLLDGARERAAGDRLILRAWHNVNQSRRAVERAYWARAAAAAVVDDAKIAVIEEQLRLIA